MNRHDARLPAVKKTLVRAGALAGLLFYGLLSLNPADFISVFRPTAKAESAIGTEAIPVPGAMESPGQAHKCCCKHTGNRCEMGCCAGNDLVPGEPRFHACGGQSPLDNPDPFRLADHLVPSADGSGTPSDRALYHPSPVRSPLCPPSSPPGKIPIA